jgi:hypothetical protein
MTSAITPSTVSTTFPVAGQDNNSQGFRDNFAAIASNFTHAASEITALQTVSILTADLATQVNTVVNNLQGSTLSNGLYQLMSGTFYSATGVSGSVSIDLSQGAVQQYILGGNTTFNFALTGSSTGWPNYTGVSVYSRAVILLQSNTLGVWTPTFTTTGGTVSFDTNFPLIPGTAQQGVSVGGESVSSIAVGTKGSGYQSLVSISFSGGSPITNYTLPTASATYTVVGASASSNIYNSSTGVTTPLTVTATSGTGLSLGTATLTFAAQRFRPYEIGNTIIVSGVSPSAYNGVYTVTACDTTTVSYTSSASGSMVSAGTITAGVPGNGYAVGDIVVMNSNPDVQLIVSAIATSFSGTVTANSNTITNVTNFTNIANGLTVTAATGTIPASTTITGFNVGLGTVTLSQNATGVGSTATDTLITYVSSTGPVKTLSGFPIGTMTAPVVGVRSFTSITGSGTGLRAAINSGVGAINVTTPGDGYTTTPPTVTISNGGGTGVTATASITAGTGSRIQAIEAWTVNGGRNVYLRYLGQY